MTKSLENNDFLKGFGRFSVSSPDTFEKLKCLETGEMTKSLDNNDFLKGFGCFSRFQTRQNPLNTESVWKQGNDKIP